MADSLKNYRQVAKNLKNRANTLKGQVERRKIETSAIVGMAPRNTRRGGGRGKRRPAKRVPVQFGPKTLENTVKNALANVSKAVNEARTWGDFQIEEDAKKKKKGGRRTRKNKKD